MIRLFYTCPIIAAMMAKHHGVKMLYRRDGKELLHPLPLWQFARRIEFGDGKEQYVIHQDSLGIFDPIVGDIVINCDDMPALVVKDSAPPETHTVSLSVAKEFVGKEASIILRGGFPFVMPESEAA